MDASTCNIFTAICPRNKKPGDSFDVTDPTGTRMRVIIPHGIKAGQRFSIRGRGTSRRKSGHSKDQVPAFAVHKETLNLGALSAKSKTSFGWRFIYANPDERDREHSLYVKYSRNSRNLRVWFDGANKIDTNIPDRMSVVHRIDMKHKDHKLGVKLLMNEDEVEALFEIDGFEFEKLPQPDQLMTRQVCIPCAIAVRRAIEDVGKIVASSKQRYTWEFKFPHTSASQFITLTWSGSTLKVFQNDVQIFTKKANTFFRGGTVFEHIFPVNSVEYRVSIERAPPSSEDARTGGASGNGSIATLYMGGIAFEDLPKSQREYDLKHSKELIRNLRKRTGSTLSVPSTPERPKVSAKIQTLVEMGFDSDAAAAALLSSGGDLQEAINMLVKANESKQNEDDDLGLGLGDLSVSSEKKKKTKKRRSTGKKKKKKKSVDDQGTDDLLSDLFAPVSSTTPASTTTTTNADDPFAMLAQSIEGEGSTTTAMSTSSSAQESVRTTTTTFTPPKIKKAIDSDDPFANLF